MVWPKNVFSLQFVMLLVCVSELSRRWNAARNNLVLVFLGGPSLVYIECRAEGGEELSVNTEQYSMCKQLSPGVVA